MVQVPVSFFEIYYNIIPVEEIRLLHKVFKERRLRLSVAESCTGGMISHLITMLPGASQFFEAGAVTYSIESKKRILGIPEEIISEYGVVSEKVAIEMARRILELTETDYSISTTGNLGPDVLEGKERGLVYIGMCKRTHGEVTTMSRELRLRGDREENKKDASFEAIRFLLEGVNGV